MIPCSLIDLIQRCAERGYTLEEVRACIVYQHESSIVVDETHPDYPRDTKPGFIPQQQQPAAPTSGPGTELKKLLKKIGITATPNCSCNARARRMDEEEARNPGWCEEHLEEIVGWLREEASNRGLPFLDAAGRMIVRRAIKNAKRLNVGMMGKNTNGSP